MQKVPFLSVILFLLVSSFQINVPKEKLQWLSLEEAEQKSAQEPRPLLIDLYTDWCGWCKVMDRKTYSSQDLIKYLNQKFYVVKLNAESKKDITWKGKVYSYNAGFRTHDIAITFTKGELAYPTTVILPVNENDPQAIAGMLDVKEMEMLTKYFGENKYGKVSFDDYAKSFSPSWK